MKIEFLQVAFYGLMNKQFKLASAFLFLALTHAKCQVYSYISLEIRAMAFNGRSAISNTGAPVGDALCKNHIVISNYVRVTPKSDKTLLLNDSSAVASSVYQPVVRRGFAISR
jgi:hypothetical protein